MTDQLIFDCVNLVISQSLLAKLLFSLTCKDYYEVFKTKISNELVEEVVVCNNMYVLEYTKCTHKSVIYSCIKHNNIDMYKWLYDNFANNELYFDINHDIIKYSRLEIFQYTKLPSNIQFSNIEWITNTAINNNVKMLDYLYSINIRPILLLVTAEELASLNNFESIKWLHKHGWKLFTGICKGAVKCGNLEMIKYGLECGDVLTKGVFYRAIKKGDLNILNFLVDNNCPKHKDSCEYAAKNGNLEILKWAVDIGCEINPTNLLSLNLQFEIEQYLTSFL
jgi:hypothetical protein